MQRLSEHIKARNNALFKSFHEGKFLRSSKHEKSVLDLLRPGTTRTDLCDRTIRDHDEPAWALIPVKGRCYANTFIAATRHINCAVSVTN